MQVREKARKTGESWMELALHPLKRTAHLHCSVSRLASTSVATELDLTFVAAAAAPVAAAVAVMLLPAAAAVVIAAFVVVLAAGTWMTSAASGILLVPAVLIQPLPLVPEAAVAAVLI